ncbi:hypothetical protein ACS0TY_028536 [Phlomoides rotata]
MKISIKSYTTRKLFRYSLNCTLLSSLNSPKTLNPKNPRAAAPPNSVITIPSVCDSSSGSSPFFFPLQESPVLSISPSESSSVLRFKPYLPIKNRYLINPSSWFSERCKIESHASNICLTPKSCNVYSSSVWPDCGNLVRYYSVSSSNGGFSSLPVVERNGFSQKLVLEIVDILRNSGEDVESRLNILHSRLSKHLITEIFEVLNCQRISGLRFFEWFRKNNPQLHKNAYICSLVIDNAGRLDDYETMSTLLKMITAEKICLSYEAFRFLAVWACEDSSLKESTKRVVDLLNGVGGSCRSSGICALIEMFCKLHMFEMAWHVIKVTERNISYYCLLVREKCRSGLTEDAYSIIKEMRHAHCAPNTTVYNYLLGSLWKNGRMGEASALLDEMKENGIPSDAITFEILINSACSLGDMDDVRQLLDQMLTQGLEPRTSTYAYIIKTLFAAEKYEAAYKYVVDSSVIYKTSSNMMYSLLASLYRRKGDMMSAGNTLVEMMEKNLKPDFSIYVKIVKQLRRTGKAKLARDLEIRHSKFVIKSGAGVS